MTDQLPRIEDTAHKHYLELSSHVRERKTAQLLEQCVVELRRLREAQAENVRLTDLLNGEPQIARLEGDKTGILLDVEHWAAKLLARSFAKTLGDAENYVTMELEVDDTPMVVTVQRRWGKSLAAAISELKAENARLRDENALLSQSQKQTSVAFDDYCEYVKFLRAKYPDAPSVRQWVCEVHKTVATGSSPRTLSR